MKAFIRSVGCAALLGTSLMAQGNEGNAALYDAVPPADSAFVRVLNASAAPVEVSVSGKSNTLKISGVQMSSYVFMEQGERSIKVNDQTISVPMASNTATTLVFDGGRLMPIQDEFSEDNRRAKVVFYNLTDAALKLKTLDGKHVIVDDVNGGQMGTRKVNEVKMTFAAYAGDAKVADFEEMFMRRGRSYSYVILGNGSGYSALTVTDHVESLE